MVKSNDIEVVSKENDHTLGIDQSKEPILVERIRYTSALEKMDPLQRDLVMVLKVKSLSIDPKPKGLRTLKCMGV